MEKLLTCEQVAERYNVKNITVREWIKSKKLSAIKVAGSTYRIRAEDLIAFEKQYETKGGGVIHAENN
ncbi:MAG: excisionase family DNA-binding protein [Oscillospiraceae bacterium]|jgi:excisionase family DNA binding protein|nr:excisionase family DNA-binding protein [Oscillospiraceae bacterium]